MKSRILYLNGTSIEIRDPQNRCLSRFELQDLANNLSWIDNSNGIRIILAEQPLRERSYTFPTAQQAQIRSMADLSLKEDLSSDIDLFFAVTSQAPGASPQETNINISYFRDDVLIKLIADLELAGVPVTHITITGRSDNFIPQKWMNQSLLFNQIGQGINILKFAALGLALVTIILFTSIILSDRSDKISRSNQRNNSSPEMVRLVDEYNQIQNSLKASKQAGGTTLNPAYLISKAGNAITPGLRFTEMNWNAVQKKITIKAEAANVRTGMDLIDVLRNDSSFKKVKLVSIKERPSGNTELEAALEVQP